MQAEQIDRLKDEISVLKGEKGRPNIKPGNLNHDGGNATGGGGQKLRGKPGCRKTHRLKIHHERVIEPDGIPADAKFKEYETYVVQDITIELSNTCYRRARYDLPGGGTLIGELPAEVKGSHFGSTLRSYILSQYYQQHVPQNLILRQIREMGVLISAGQLSQIITEKKEAFHAEKDGLLQAGLEVSSYIQVDDTGARHKGRNGYCTHIGNEFFASFSSTGSKSRINFLELLQAGRTEYVINDTAREYMRQQRMPPALLRVFAEDQVVADKAAWQLHLKTLGLSERCSRIATEGALAASLLMYGKFSELVVMSDDAGQFNVAGFLNTLCWVHAERTINKIIPYCDDNRAAQALVRDQIWQLYQDLKSFKAKPDQVVRTALARRFDEIFTQKTCFQTLNLALQRIHRNKSELLLVLKRPEIPLHNNLSENDIRDYVKKRKISATTRSDNGRRARDTMLSLKKTCQKLGISFGRYLQDRISGQNLIPQLPDLIRTAAASP